MLHTPSLAMPGPSVLSGAWIHTVEEIPGQGGQQRDFAEPLSHLAIILLRRNRSGESHSAGSVLLTLWSHMSHLNNTLVT